MNESSVGTVQDQWRAAAPERSRRGPTTGASALAGTDLVMVRRPRQTTGDLAVVAIMSSEPWQSLSGPVDGRATVVVVVR